ncbi:MAG: ABC transporter permease [Treponema sp.]|jgi:ABC-type dipeptide/oligopeptide/nickel transport system permease component|nr:ABC transporter permease [Treponema sp.]
MGYIGKRLAITVLTLFLVSLLTFAAFRLIPGDAALLALDVDATEEQIALFRAELGLDRSFPVQYLSWLGKFLTGNMGNSSRFRGLSISAMVLERLPVTFHLALLSLVFIVFIAVPASLPGIQKEDSPLDRLMNAFTALNISMPGFFLGVLLIWIFGISFKLFTPGAYVDYREDYGAFLGCLAFPALAIALPNAAILTKFLRSSIFREYSADYVRTARSKGLGRNGVLFRHALKNASLPAVTLLGMITGEVFSGSIVIEQVFTIPGVGRLLIASITARDYPLVETLVVYIAFVVILGNTLVDIVISIIDPRIADSRVRGE